MPPGGCGMRSSSQSCVPLLAVLGGVDRVGRRARHQLGWDVRRQLERRLATERHHHLRGDTAGGRGLGGDHVGHVLGRERLEVQPVGRVVVGGHGLRVAVDHHRLVAGVAQGEAGVDAAVVELDALADAVGTRAEDDDTRPIRRLHLVGVLPRRVVVRRARGELGGARVDGLVGGVPRRRPIGRRRPDAPSTPQRWASWASEKPRRLARRQSARVRSASGSGRRGAGAPRRSPASGRGTTRRCGSAAWTSSTADPASEQLADLEDRARGSGTAIAASSASVVGAPTRPRRGRRRGRGGPARASAAPSAALGEGAPDRHHLADRLHLRAEHGGGAGQLLERPAGHLGDHVVDHRLEATPAWPG